MAEIGCNWARIGPSKSSQSLSIAHKWAVVTVNGPLKRVRKLAGNLQSRVKEEDSITDVENAVFELGVMDSLCRSKNFRRHDHEVH
ncbi:hypothetical protein Tco_1392472 [Tanacetum coccineum]